MKHQVLFILFVAELSRAAKQPCMETFFSLLRRDVGLLHGLLMSSRKPHSAEHSQTARGGL